MKKFINPIGEKYTTNEGCLVEIIKCINSKNCTVIFENGYITTSSYQNIKKGQIKNPYHISVVGVGFIGVGKYKIMVDGKQVKEYNVWKNILERCYEKRSQIDNSTYMGCSVGCEWHNFQNFAQWWEENYVRDFHLDKDILIKGNRTYSPETCCFVPQEINNILNKKLKSRGNLPIGVLNHKSGKYSAQISINSSKKHLGYFDTIEEAFQAYKTAKEIYIKEMADKWKPEITPQTYQALIDYVVEITD
jgi:hypothetical protein